MKKKMVLGMLLAALVSVSAHSQQVPTADDFAGSWIGRVDGFMVFVLVTATDWIFISTGGISGNGTYTVRGQTATVATDRITFGTATLTNINSMEVVLSRESGFPGRFVLTRQR